MTILKETIRPANEITLTKYEELFEELKKGKTMLIEATTREVNTIATTIAYREALIGSSLRLRRKLQLSGNYVIWLEEKIQGTKGRPRNI